MSCVSDDFHEHCKYIPCQDQISLKITYLLWDPTSDRDISNSAIYTTAINQEHTVPCQDQISLKITYL